MSAKQKPYCMLYLAVLPLVLERRLLCGSEEVLWGQFWPYPSIKDVSVYFQVSLGLWVCSRPFVQ